MSTIIAPVIVIEALSFAYDGLTALQDISLTVAAGEFLGIVGPNAGGKSTLLKLILGILKPQKGTIKVMGLPPKAVRCQIGYVPQYPPFARDFPITVEQAVLMGRLGHGAIIGGYSRMDRVLVSKTLAEVEASELASRQISTLSGGQLQRVLLARALVGDPKLLILDEPTANIDQRIEGEIFDLLRGLNQRWGRGVSPHLNMTILVVSHDIAFISGYVSRVACLNRTLLCHSTSSIKSGDIQAMYGEHVRQVTHDTRPCAF